MSKLTPEQQARRVGYIGSGHSSALLGFNEYQTVYDAWAQITDKLPPLKPSPAMRAGLILEGAVIDWAEEELGVKIEREVDCFAGSPLHVGPDYCGAHLDGLFYDGDAPVVVEAKTSGIYAFLDKDEWGEANTDQVPERVVVQCHHHMLCSGASLTVVPALIPPKGFRMFRVERDDQLIEAMLDIYHHFWTNHVLADSAPEDSLPSVSTVRKIHRLPDITTSIDAKVVTALEEARQAAKDAKDRADMCLQELGAALGQHEVASFTGGLLTFKADKRGARRLVIKRKDKE